MKNRKKQTKSARYQGYKDISPNNSVEVWVKDKNPTHPTKTAARNYIDYDYLDKLSPKEREWLDKFTREYYLNNFEKGKRPLHKKKERTELYDNDNKRRRAYELSDGQPIDMITNRGTFSPEDAIINYLDYLKSKS